MCHACVRDFNSSFYVLTTNISRSSISVAVSSRRIPIPMRSTKIFRPGGGWCFAVFFCRDISKWSIHELRTTKRSVSVLSSLLVIEFFQIPSSDHSLASNNARWIDKLKQDPPQTDCSPAICLSPTAVGVRYRQKYLKRRFSYPSVITNQEAHMIYGNMDQRQGNTEKNKNSKKRPGSTQITDFFSKASNAGKLSLNFLISMQFFKTATSPCARAVTHR